MRVGASVVDEGDGEGEEGRYVGDSGGSLYTIRPVGEYHVLRIEG